MDIGALLAPSLPAPTAPGLAPSPPPPTPGPGLPSLPHELLAGIFEHVAAPLALVERSDLITRPHTGNSLAHRGDCKTARRTILNACLVCRKFLGPARESLYRNITLASGKDIPYLLRTLLLSRSAHNTRHGDPILPSLVRNITCLAVLDDPESNMTASSTWDQVRPDPVPNGTGFTILNTLGLCLPAEASRDTFYLGTKRANWTIQRLLAAVLALSPELRSLLLEDPSERYSTLNACLAALQQNRQVRDQILRKFTKISTRTDGRPHGLDSVLSSFLSLGTTRIYNAHYGPEPFGLHRHRQSALLTRLESVTMTCCVAPGQTLLTLADSCSHLRHLTLHCLTWQQEDSAVFGSELPKLALTLETLSLQGYIVDRETSRDNVIRRPLARRCSMLDCLPQMTNLAVLTISMSLLVSSITDIEYHGIVQRLPPRLEHLRILEEPGLFPADLAAIGGSLLQAAWDCPQRLPKLRDFVYSRETVNVADDENDSMELEIRSRFASSGINFRLESRTDNLEYHSN